MIINCLFNKNLIPFRILHTNLVHQQLLSRQNLMPQKHSCRKKLHPSDDQNFMSQWRFYCINFNIFQTSAVFFSTKFHDQELPFWQKFDHFHFYFVDKIWCHRNFHVDKISCTHMDCIDWIWFSFQSFKF